MYAFSVLCKTLIRISPLILRHIPNNTVMQKSRMIILSWWGVISVEIVTAWTWLLVFLRLFWWVLNIPPLNSSWVQHTGSQTLACFFFSPLPSLKEPFLYKKGILLFFFSRANFLSLTCYKMSHVKKPSMCEVYPFSVKTLQTKQLACSLFKMLLLKAELSRETSYVWSIIQCVWDNNTL